MSVAMPVSPDQPAPSPGRIGRLRQEGLDDSDRNYAVATHLSALILLILGAGLLTPLGPLVLWLVRRNQSAFDDDHGKEVLNFGISFLLWHVLLAITVVGLALWPVLWVVAIVNNVRGAVAAGNGEYFRYPMTIRFLS